MLNVLMQVPILLACEILVYCCRDRPRATKFRLVRSFVQDLWRCSPYVLVIVGSGGVLPQKWLDGIW